MLFSDILIPHGFFIEFASKTQLNYFRSAQAEIERRENQRGSLLIFVDTILGGVKHFLLMPYGSVSMWNCVLIVI